MSKNRQVRLTQSQIMQTIDNKVESQLMGNRNSLLILGPPGFGKSALVETDYPEWKEGRGSRALGMDECTVGVFNICLANNDSCDFVIPVPDLVKGELKMLSNGEILGLSEAQSKYDIVIVFLDEATSASEDTLVSIQPVIQSWSLRGKKKAGNTVYIMAGNRPEDMSGARHLPASMMDRCTTLELAPDTFRWLEWAKAKGIDARLVGAVAWANQNGENILYQQPKEKGEVIPSPRSYERLSDSLKMESAGYGVMDDEVVDVMGSGDLGDETWIKIKGFFRMNSELPYISQIIDAPMAAPLPGSIDPVNGPSGQYIVATGMAKWIQNKKEKEEHIETRIMDQFIRYFRRMTPEIAIHGVKLCVEMDPGAFELSKEFGSFRNEHNDVTLYTGHSFSYMGAGKK